MIDPPTYLISSHINYSDALARLLTSMRHIESRRKWVYIGGATKRAARMLNGHLCEEVLHNSFDYTALIEWARWPKPRSSHVFLLHDTMEFGRFSDELIRQADPEMQATAAHMGGQTNLVCFRADYLRKQAPYIETLRDLTKLQAIQHEGRLWAMAPKRDHYKGATCINAGEERPYGGALRLKEIYPAVDITKFKSNHGQSMTEFEVRP